MKTFKFDNTELDRAAKAAGLTPEKFVSNIRSLSLGRKVCAHYQGTEGNTAIFLCE